MIKKIRFPFQLPFPPMLKARLIFCTLPLNQSTWWERSLKN
jgi:hypothetical protein